MQILESTPPTPPVPATSFSPIPAETASDTETRNRAILNALMVKKRGPRQSPLESDLSTERLAWLARYAKARRDSYYAALSGWRTKLERYQLQSEDNFSWRRTQGNRNHGRKSIFESQNDSLNIVGAFAEFFTAQAKNDLFGSTPWFAAKPEGVADHYLADHLTKHCTWKLRHSGLHQTYKEAVKIATDLGACFTKKTWLTCKDEFEETLTVLQDAQTKKPILTTTGDVIHADDPIMEEADESGELRRYPVKDPETDLTSGSYEYNTAYRKQERTTYQNVKAYNLHFKDVAFDPTAPELSLYHTDFFHSFTKGLADIRKDYHLKREDALRIHHALAEQTEAMKPLGHRGEQQVDPTHETEHGDTLPNTPVRLMEGYMRVDATGRNKVCNLYIVFCPEIELVLKVDYLANITPGGLLPVHVHTIERIPHRIVGRGFYEHLETAQTVIDDLFNRINWHDRKRSSPIMGFDKTQLKLEDEDEDEPFDDEKPVNLKPGARLEDFIQFKDYPDLSNRTHEMMQLFIQMVQLRKGITAAAQGDTSLPESNTATGIRQIMSRAAVLLKSPIDDLKHSFTQDLNYVVKLLYSNFSHDEAFVFGEGENMKLIQLTAREVHDLDIDVEILLTQAQNQFKLENARAGIDLYTQYVQLPEPEKQHGRRLFIQALTALDFADADQIIRPAAVDLESALSILPEELQQQIQSALDAQEKAAPPEDTAPEAEPPGGNTPPLPTAEGEAPDLAALMGALGGAGGAPGAGAAAPPPAGGMDPMMQAMPQSGNTPPQPPMV